MAKKDNSTTFRQFNLGLNKMVGYALFYEGHGLAVYALAALLNYSFNYTALFSLNVQGCVSSCLDSCGIYVVPKNVVSATHVSASPSCHSTHKLSLVKAFPLFICRH